MPYDRGPQLFDPALILGGGGLSAVTGITARAGGTRAAALPLAMAINHVTVCATAADSVALPAAIGGQQMVVVNSGAAAMQVFAAVGTADTINGVAAATGISMAVNAKQLFVSPAPGLWFGILSA